MAIEKETLEAFAECNKAIERLKNVLASIDLSKLKNIKFSTIAQSKTDSKEIAIP